MPRDMQETITLSDFDDVLRRITQDRLRVQFEATHLDVVASKLNDVFGLTGDDVVTRQDVLDILYSDVYSEGTFANSLDVINELNTCKVVDNSNKEDFISSFVAEDEQERNRVKKVFLREGLFGLGMMGFFAVLAHMVPPPITLLFLPFFSIGVVGMIVESLDKLAKNAPKTRNKRAEEAYTENVVRPYGAYQEKLNTIVDLFEKADSNERGNVCTIRVKQSQIKHPKLAT